MYRSLVCVKSRLCQVQTFITIVVYFFAIEFNPPSIVSTKMGRKSTCSKKRQSEMDVHYNSVCVNIYITTGSGSAGVETIFVLPLPPLSIFFCENGKTARAKISEGPLTRKTSETKEKQEKCRTIKTSFLFSFLQPEEKNLWDHLSWAANYALLNELSGVCTQRPSSVPSNNRNLPSAMPNAKLLGFAHRTAKDAQSSIIGKGESQPEITIRAKAK